MPGQQPTRKTEAPCHNLSHTQAWATPPAQTIPLFVAERRICIDSLTARYKTACGSANVGTIEHVPSGTAMSGTSVVATGSVNLNTTANTVLEADGLTTGNIVPAGSLVFLRLSAAVGSLADLAIAVRYSTIIQ